MSPNTIQRYNLKFNSLTKYENNPEKVIVIDDWFLIWTAVYFTKEAVWDPFYIFGLPIGNYLANKFIANAPHQGGFQSDCGWKKTCSYTHTTSGNTFTYETFTDGCGNTLEIQTSISIDAEGNIINTRTETHTDSFGLATTHTSTFTTHTFTSGDYSWTRTTTTDSWSYPNGTSISSSTTTTSDHWGTTIETTTTSTSTDSEGNTTTTTTSSEYRSNLDASNDGNNWGLGTRSGQKTKSGVT